MLESAALQIKLIRKYLKLKILEDNVSFRGHNLERKHVSELVRKAVVNGESHSAVIIGPRGCGKTTLVNTVLSELSKEVDLQNDAIIIQLNGLIHHDEKIALKAITAQMQLENAVGDRVFGTFAENLAFLLSCLQSGVDRKCKSMLFVLDEFDLFCHSGRTQTLLYNLFDIAHSEQAPMCVLGLTSRLDVIDLLEKRVKSRFSHRHVFIFPNEVTDDDYQVEVTSPLENFKRLMVELCCMPLQEEKVAKADKRRRSTKKSTETKMDIDNADIKYVIPKEIFNRCKVNPEEFSELDPGFLEDWNSHVSSLVQNDKIVDALEKFCYYTVNEQIFRDVLFQVISKLSTRKPYIDASDVTRAIDNAVSSDQTIEQLQSLSILELSLVIAMKHSLEIFDGQPMNFEMILHRYTKFANSHSSSQKVPRPVILKAFEHLQQLEIIVPVKHTEGLHSHTDSTSRVQKEYQLFTSSVSSMEIDEAVKKFKALPTEIAHWCTNSII